METQFNKPDQESIRSEKELAIEVIWYASGA